MAGAKAVTMTTAAAMTAVAAVRGRVGGWWRARREAVRRDAGMSTAEYAVGTIAAAAFAAVLYKVVTSGTVSGALESMIGKALDASF
ncbi:DUF4244 domain-containing protein [Streptomyces sp. NPDC088757]|uniref:DUF4244 domain-containing protein n=1 Tax=Streptomyces sp. NPDC088757 TaxID=3365889 RepID=UPI00380F17D2